MGKGKGVLAGIRGREGMVAGGEGKSQGHGTEWGKGEGKEGGGSGGKGKGVAKSHPPNGQSRAGELSPPPSSRHMQAGTRWGLGRARGTGTKVKCLQAGKGGRGRGPL